MLNKINKNNMGNSDYGWLKTIYHFSFSNYYNPNNMNFGVLRVLNDDIIDPHNGFDTHPHKDMEIVTYVIDGELTHKDSMGNSETITRGQIQYMSAGTGIYHSEENLSNNKLRLIQLWITPDKRNYKPNYGDLKVNYNERDNKWLHIVSDRNGNAPIKINQDVNIYSTNITSSIEFKVEKTRQAYLVLMEGKCTINDIELNEKDALEVIEEYIVINPINEAHILLIEMSKEK